MMMTVLILVVFCSSLQGSSSANGGASDSDQLRAKLHQLFTQSVDDQLGGGLQRQGVVACHYCPRSDAAVSGLQLWRPVHDDPDPRHANSSRRAAGFTVWLLRPGHRSTEGMRSSVVAVIFAVVKLWLAQWFINVHVLLVVLTYCM